MNDTINETEQVQIEDGPREFKIPAYRREIFQKKIDQANNRLTRAGATGRLFQVSYEPFEARKTVGGYELTDPLSGAVIERLGGTEVTEPWYLVTLVGGRITLGNYTFVAALVAEEAGYTVHCAPGESLDGWKRPAVDDIHCDHCGIDRNRKRLYIIRDEETAELLQLGHSCIELYTGMQPKGLWALTYDEELRSVEEEDRGHNFGQASYGIPVNKVLGYAYAFSNEGRSYVSKKLEDASFGAAKATASVVRGALLGIHRPPERRWFRSAADYQKALDEYNEYIATIERGEAFSKDEALMLDIRVVGETLKAGTDYADNMAVILAGENVSGRNVGILASLVSVYAREKELAVKRATAPKPAKGFLADVKVRIKTELRIRLTTVRERESDFGPTTFMVGYTPDMHCVVWKASGSFDVEAGDVLVLSAATVKAHETYGDTNPIDQTVITRGAVKEIVKQEK